MSICNTLYTSGRLSLGSVASSSSREIPRTSRIAWPNVCRMVSRLVSTIVARSITMPCAQRSTQRARPRSGGISAPQAMKLFWPEKPISNEKRTHAKSSGSSFKVKVPRRSRAGDNDSIGAVQMAVRLDKMMRQTASLTGRAWDGWRQEQPAWLFSPHQPSYYAKSG